MRTQRTLTAYYSAEKLAKIYDIPVQAIRAAGKHGEFRTDANGKPEIYSFARFARRFGRDLPAEAIRENIRSMLNGATEKRLKAEKGKIETGAIEYRTLTPERTSQKRR